MIVNAYQTVEDRGDRDAVEAEGPFRCTRSDAWLGSGYYFWDTDLDRAHDWGRFAYRKFRKKYMIGWCELVINEGREENCFDLFGNVGHLKDFEESIEAFLKAGYLEEEDELLMPKIVELLRKQSLLDYSAIRAADYPKEDRDDEGKPTAKVVYFHPRKKEYMYLNPRVQICVLDKPSVLLSSFQVIYPEES